MVCLKKNLTFISFNMVILKLRVGGNLFALNKSYKLIKGSNLLIGLAPIVGARFRVRPRTWTHLTAWSFVATRSTRMKGSCPWI